MKQKVGGANMENKLQEIKQNYSESHALYGAIHYLGSGKTQFEQRDDISASDDILWLIKTVEQQQQEIERYKEYTDHLQQEIQWQYGKLNQISDLIERGRDESKIFIPIKMDTHPNT